MLTWFLVFLPNLFKTQEKRRGVMTGSRDTTMGYVQMI